MICVNIKPRSRSKTALLIVAAAALIAWMYASGVWRAIPDWIRASGVYGVLLSYMLVLLQTVIPFVPFAVLAGFNATVHGYWVGYLSTWAGAFTGSVLLYYISGHVMQRHFRSRLQRWLANHPKWLKRQQMIARERGWSVFLVLLLLRIQPWLPASVIDILSGLSRVAWLPYLAATFLAQGPMIALESYVGHRLLNFPSHRQEIWWIAGVSFGGLVIYLAVRFMAVKFRKHEHQ